MVKSDYKAGFIWGCRHQQNSTPCNEYLNKKAAYLADRFEPISEKVIYCVKFVHSFISFHSGVNNSLNSLFSLIITDVSKTKQCVEYTWVFE